MPKNYLRTAMSYSVKDLILQERIKHLYMNAVPGLIVTSIVSSVLAFGFNHHPVKGIWWLVLNMTLLARTLDYIHWKKNQNLTLSALYRFRAGLISTAVIWPFFCLYFYNKSDIYELAISMVIVSGMAGGATTVMAGDRLSVNVYIFFLIIPFSVRVLLDQGSPYQLMGILGLAFYAVMLTISKKTVNYVNESIELRLQNKKLIDSMHHEIMVQTERNKELLQQDSLTRLLNRTAFIDKSADKIKAAVDLSTTFSVFFIDLNNFKPINDNLGHKVGDKVLKEVANEIVALAGPDSLVCRWGGDEFVILKKCSEADSLNLGYQINKQLSRELYVDGYQINTGAAIGISAYPLHSESMDELIAFADMAMYVHKNNKTRACVLFDSAMSEKVANEFHLSASIRDAILQNKLKTYYQPIVDSQTNVITAVEALVRWEIAPNKFIAPDIFIPLAEKNGFIVELGYWVLKTALTDITSLDKYGYDLHICVNVSVSQFQDKNFVENVIDIIHCAGVNPNRVHIELTESVFASDGSVVAQKIKQLQDFGIKISIDDFGTGYSSLSLIQSLHVNTVKIDKSFVSKIHGSGIEVIKAIIIMAKGLGYDVVAEGVETKEQSLRLTDLGVKYLQGYYYSKPVPLESLIMLLEREKQLGAHLYCASA